MSVKEQMRTRGFVEPIDVPRDGPPGLGSNCTQKPASNPAKLKSAARFQTLNQFVDQSMRTVGAVAQRVWFVIFRETKPDGTAKISHARIGDLIGIKRRAVIRATQELVDAGLLVVVKRGGADHTPSTYRAKGRAN